LRWDGAAEYVIASTMNRRDFLRSTGVASAGLALPQRGRLFPWRATPPGRRTFEVTTHVEVLKPSGTTRVWGPAPLLRDTPDQKPRAIYEWVVDHTFRNPKTRGCGLGDIRFMLETGDLSGKCADLNALYVGLARAAGLPARDVYGIRVAKSALGFQSLGPSSEHVTKAQHCRAEVYLDGYGWIPVDPADVRKVV